MIKLRRHQATLLFVMVVLGGCAALAPPLRAGLTTEDEVLGYRGVPTLRWDEANGEAQMVWATGPQGTSTIKARFDVNRRLLAYEEVLTVEHFAQIRPAMSMDEVVHQIGPPYPGWTAYFQSRDELVWEWRYCDAWGEAARFNVLFDGASRKVRSTLSLTEGQRFNARYTPSCGHSYINFIAQP